MKIPCGHGWPSAALNWFPLIEGTAKSRPRKVAESFAATADAGKLSAPSAGCKTSAGSLRVTNTTLIYLRICSTCLPHGRHEEVLKWLLVNRLRKVRA